MSTSQMAAFLAFLRRGRIAAFDQITRIPEYYVTRTERAILHDHAAEIVSRAAGEHSLRLGRTGRRFGGQDAAAAERRG